MSNRRFPLPMKTWRIVLIAGLAHFGLWWFSYVVLLWFDFDVLGPSQLSPTLQIVYKMHRVLTFPLMFEPVNSLVRHLPPALVTATNGFVWAGCLGIVFCILKRVLTLKPSNCPLDRQSA